MANLFMGQLKPVIVPFTAPSTNNMGLSRLSRQQDKVDTGELSDEDVDIFKRLQGLPGANKAMKDYYLNLDGTYASAKGQLRERILSGDVSPEEQEALLSQYANLTNAYNYRKAGMYVNAETAKFDLDRYKKDYDYVTSKDKASAPLLGFDYGDVVSSRNQQVDAYNLFAKDGDSLVVINEQGNMATVDDYMNFSRDSMAISNDGRPEPYNAIVRSSSDKDYKDHMTALVGEAEKNVNVSYLLSDEYGKPLSMAGVSSIIQGSGYMQKTVRSNKQSLDAVLSNMMDILPKEDINRAAERLISSDVIAYSKDKPLKLKDKSNEFEFSGSVSDLLIAMRQQRSVAMDSKKSPSEREFATKTGIALADKFNAMVKAQIITDAAAIAENRYNTQVQPQFIRARVDEKRDKINALEAVLGPDAIRTIASNNKMPQGKVTFFNKNGVKYDWPVYSGTFDSNKYAREYIEVLTDKDMSKNDVINVSDLGTSILIFGNRAYSPDDMPLELANAQIKTVGSHWMVGPGITNGVGKSYVDPASGSRSTYIDAYISLTADQMRTLKLPSAQSATVGTDKDAIAIIGKEYSAARMNKLELTGSPMGIGAPQNVGDNFIIPIQIPFTPEATGMFNNSGVNQTRNQVAASYKNAALSELKKDYVIDDELLTEDERTALEGYNNAEPRLNMIPYSTSPSGKSTLKYSYP